MPRFLQAFPTKDGPRYLEWSTVVDAPVSGLMTEDELRSWYQREYGLSGMVNFDLALQNANLRDVHDVIACNRAGPDETEASLEEIIEWYSPGGRGMS